MSSGLRLNPRIVHQVDPSFDKQRVSENTLKVAFKNPLQYSELTSLEINPLPTADGMKYQLLDGEKELSPQEFQKRLVKIGDGFLESPDLSLKILNIAVSQGIGEDYSNFAKQALNAVFTKPEPSSKDDLLGVLITAYQKNSHEHQVSSAFDLVDKLNLKTLSIEEALDDFKQKMRAYGKVGDSLLAYGTSLISLALDRRADDLKDHLLEGEKLDDILKSNPALAEKAKKTYAKIINKAAEETSIDLDKQSRHVTNYAKQFQAILVDLVTYPESSTNYQDAVTAFHNTIQEFSEEQTLSLMKQEALANQLRILQTNNPSQIDAANRLSERFQRLLNIEYMKSQDRDENFTDALSHVRQILGKIENTASLSDPANPGFGLSLKIFDSLVAEISPGASSVEKRLNTPLERLLAGEGFSTDSERIERGFVNFYDTEIRQRTTQVLSSIPVSNKLKTLDFPSSIVNPEQLVIKYGEALAKNFSDSIAMICNVKQEALIQPVIDQCINVVDDYRVKSETSNQSGKDFFVNFIERLLNNIQRIFNLDEEQN